MRKNLTLLLVCIILAVVNATVVFAQNVSNPKTHEVGSIFTYTDLKEAYNAPKETVSISDQKGKLVIFDIWATWCSPCVATIPRLNAIQEKFKDRVKVVLVNNQGKEIVETFYKERKDLMKLNMVIPSLYNDVLLNNLFPHRTIPHTVIISPTGKVAAITHASELTDSVITVLLANKDVDLVKKMDREKSTVDETVPFFAEKLSKAVYINEGIRDGLKFRSSITPNVKEVRGGHSRWIYARGYSSNNLIKSLYSIAYEFDYNDDGKSDGGFKSNKMILDVAKDDPLIRPIDRKNEEKFADDNLFNYEIIFPEKYKGADLKHMKEPDYLKLRKLGDQIMKNDLDKYFGYKTNIERRQMNVLTIRIVDSTKLISPSLVEKTKVIPGNLGISIKNEKYQIFLRMIKQSLQKYHIVDLTNYNGNLNFDVKAKLNDIPALSAELIKYGLLLKEEERETNVLVITNVK